jgi:SAM-dependent methyltransferase
MLVAPDGSPVELYRVIPGDEEARLIHAALSPRCTILELGCGAGRVTRGLLALGHEVVGVDNSAEMLEHVDGAETVLSDIETLRLRRRFDAVVLASHLINTSSPKARHALLRTCALHVARDGCVIIERLDPRWSDPRWATAAGARRQTLGQARMSMRDVTVRGEVLSATVDYRIGRRLLRHPFRAAILDDAATARALRSAGLSRRRWLDADHTWLLATAARR